MRKHCILHVVDEMKATALAIQQVLEHEDSYTWVIGNQYTGALRRKSMDLTRALADLRRNPYDLERRK
jgi:hypothetical protein